MVIGVILVVVDNIEPKSGLQEAPSLSILNHNSEFDSMWYRNAELNQPFDEVVRDRWVAEYDFQQDFDINPHQALAHHVR